MSESQNACAYAANQSEQRKVECMQTSAHEGGKTCDRRPSLSKDRQLSSIPRAEYVPVHQTGKKESWEYPSEEMYFHAMSKKGWDPDPEQMKTIVAIHNAVNEQTWREVLKWEAFHPSRDVPKLKRFMGRPSEYSPKARLLNLLGWSVLPFDRHDWIIDRDGKEVRYIIDFYNGSQTKSDRPISMYLDVRPALDSFENVIDRFRWQFHEKIARFFPFRRDSFGQDACMWDNRKKRARGSEVQSTTNVES